MRAVLALCIVPLCASGTNAQAPGPACRRRPGPPPTRAVSSDSSRQPPCVRDDFPSYANEPKSGRPAIEAANATKATPKEACQLFTALARCEPKVSSNTRAEHCDWCGRLSQVIDGSSTGTPQGRADPHQGVQGSEARRVPRAPRLSDALSARCQLRQHQDRSRHLRTLTGKPLGNK